MGDADLWRADGSFRGIQSSGGGGKGGGGKGGGKGGGPQFTRVIPKFLQKFHEPPAIQAKFATLPGADGEEEEELDDVQKAAIAEFLARDGAKKKGGEDGEGDSSANAPAASEAKPRKPAQAVAGVGGSAKSKQAAGDKKRKRPQTATLTNKKLLSFSLDDDE